MQIQEQFETFHSKNPEVYRELVMLASQMRATGRTRYSIDNLFGVIRWHRDAVNRQGEFLLNNNFRSRYARLIMANEPGFERFFYTRSLQTY